MNYKKSSTIRLLMTSLALTVAIACAILILGNVNNLQLAKKTVFLDNTLNTDFDIREVTIKQSKINDADINNLPESDSSEPENLPPEETEDDLPPKEDEDDNIGESKEDDAVVDEEPNDNDDLDKQDESTQDVDENIDEKEHEDEDFNVENDEESPDNPSSGDTSEPQVEPSSDEPQQAQVNPSDSRNIEYGKDGEDIKVGDISIVTNLKSEYACSYSPYTVEFYAYVKENPAAPIVFQGNSHVTSLGDNKYSVDLLYGNNIIQIVVYDDNGDPHHFTYNVKGSTELANKDQRVKGDSTKTPTLTTSVSELSVNDAGQYTAKAPEYTFRVNAETFTNEKIYADHIKISVNGKEYDRPVTFNSLGEYEFNLQFEKPVVGNTVVQTVSVVIWDDEGNSIYEEYEIEYEYKAEDSIIGTIDIYLDMTSIGLGNIYLGNFEIKSQHTYDEYILDALKQNGYSYAYDGKYLSAITDPNGGFAEYNISENLQRCIDYDIASGGQVMWKNEWRGLNIDDGTYLGEFDFTNKSGWMFCIGNNNYPGTGLNERTPNPGDTVYIRFTLNNGRDIGAVANSYCATYVNGAEYINHQYHEGKCVFCGIEDLDYLSPEDDEHSGDNIDPAEDEHPEELEEDDDKDVDGETNQDDEAPAEDLEIEDDEVLEE